MTKKENLYYPRKSKKWFMTPFSSRYKLNSDFYPPSKKYSFLIFLSLLPPFFQELHKAKFDGKLEKFAKRK